MSDRSARPDLLAGVLPTVLQRVDPDRQLRAYALWNFWSEEVGDAIAQRAQPVRVRNGILFVTVASHTWMQELQFMKETIRERLNARLGETDPPLIRDIYFVSGTIPAPAPAAVSAAQPDASMRDEAPTVLLPSAGDAQLDAAFARILRARARRAKR
ncbi:MAG TPA: DUF721 domain-containing protein [Candidatus Kryptonia bacterium]|nr:DUF721 domain-containing protein [Candidatus Kryptonia bacterium]